MVCSVELNGRSPVRTKYAKRLQYWKDVVGHSEAEKHFHRIEGITVDEETKPASGYFAYHASVTLQNCVVEVQVYSALSEAWRHLSHKLYERARLGADLTRSSDSPASRLISLGHLLNLAEHEFERIAEDLKQELPRS